MSSKLVPNNLIGVVTWIGCIQLLIYLTSCATASDNSYPDGSSILLTFPAHWPKPLPLTEDQSITPAKIKMGRALFFDPILSRDSSISCASCHHAGRAFTDGLTLSKGIHQRQGTRNTPTLVNLMYQPHFFAEGGSPSLELQVLGPLETEHEMDFSILEAVQRLKQHPAYSDMARMAFGREPDPYVITRSLAAFERTLISFRSPYDEFKANGDSSLLSVEAMRGMELFFSKRLACATCHHGPNLTDYQFHSLGLTHLGDADLGRYRITLDSGDMGAFKTPTLRNVALTAPYMHDGSIPSLDSVINFFAHGGGAGMNTSHLIHPIALEKQEKRDLKAFLEALTDSSYVQGYARLN